VQPIRLARRLLRDFAITYPHHLSEFFPTRKTLAIHRDSTGTRRGMNQHAGQIAVLDFEPANEEFCEQVIAGLSQHPRTLPCKFSRPRSSSGLRRLPPAIRIASAERRCKPHGCLLSRLNHWKPRARRRDRLFEKNRGHRQTGRRFAHGCRSEKVENNSRTRL